MIPFFDKIFCNAPLQFLIDFLISQRPETQGYEGIYCLFEQVVLREPVKRRITIPIDILTRDNIRYHKG